jgi:hypothetical protein
MVGNGCDRTVVDVTGDDTVAMQAGLSASVFSDKITDLEFRVFYESGATPYVGNVGGGNATWDITKESFKSLFQNHSRTVSVPSAVAQMTAIPDQNKTVWTDWELISLGLEITPTVIDGNNARISVIFVNGQLNGDPNIMGVQFGGYPFAFVFKDVVVSVGGGTLSQRYVEQATVVHELGHAVGLVNNGVPMQVAHEDPSHAKHSTNTDCVMFWQVESRGHILASLAAVIFGNKLNLFAAESLADGRGFHP